MIHIHPVDFSGPQDRNPRLGLGRLGDRVISRLAEQQLNQKAKAAVAELLGPGPML